MEAFSGWTTLVPSTGVLGVLLFLVIHLMRQASGDRSSYRDEISQLRDDYSRQITDLRAQMEALRTEITRLRNEVEDERRARWAAEESLAEYRRRVAAGGDSGTG